MVDRLRAMGACGHCARGGAESECPSCGRLVCSACAGDWTTCREPVGRELRLGATARLREIDGAGRFGLVSRWRGRMRLLDLRRGRWIDTPAVLPRYSALGATPTGVAPDPRLGAGATVLCATYEPDLQQGLGFTGVEITSLETGETRTVAAADPQPPLDLGMCKSGRLAWCRRPDETVALLPLAEDGSAASPMAVVDPMRGRVVQAAYAEARRHLLAAGTWGRVVLYRVAGESLERIGGFRPLDGDVVSLAVSGQRLACLAERGGRITLSVRELSGDLMPGNEIFRCRYDAALPLASLSGDGRFAAVARADRTVALHDLETGETESLPGHTDRIGLVRFAGEDDLLVTADYDGRVLLRPRTEDGYARVTAGVPVPPASIPFS